MKKQIPSIIIPQEIGVDEEEAGRMTKALCMVAHPDDCLIFGYHYFSATASIVGPFAT